MVRNIDQADLLGEVINSWQCKTTSEDRKFLCCTIVQGKVETLQHFEP